MSDTDLQPGPEMDRRVAEACGIPGRIQDRHITDEGASYGQFVRRDTNRPKGDLFQPSTDERHAFEAAEKAGLLEWPNVLYHYEVESAFGPVNRRDWKVWNADENFVVGRGSTPTEAISRAILALRPKESA